VLSSATSTRLTSSGQTRKGKEGSWEGGGKKADDGENRYGDVETLLCYVAMAQQSKVYVKPYSDHLQTYCYSLEVVYSTARPKLVNREMWPHHSIASMASPDTKQTSKGSDVSGTLHVIVYMSHCSTQSRSLKGVM
jgi:hypothetical protein